MDEICNIIGKLLEILVLRGIITPKDEKYITGKISEAEWIEDLEA